MSLRDAFAATLQYMRKQQNLTQRDIATTTDQAHVSRLESAGVSPSLEVSEGLAKAFGVDPMTLIALVYASRRGMTPQSVLLQTQAELEALGLAHTLLPEAPGAPEHPRARESAELAQKIDCLLKEGHSQAEVARQLGVHRSTVGRHVQKKL